MLREINKMHSDLVAYKAKLRQKYLNKVAPAGTKQCKCGKTISANKEICYSCASN